jgi:hypothetical protein
MNMHIKRTGHYYPTKIHFDASDKDTARFLSAIGVPQHLQSQSFLTYTDAERHNIRWEAFVAIAELPDTTKNHAARFRPHRMLSPAEARHALTLFQQHGDRARALFDRTTCVGSSVTGMLILYNMLTSFFPVLLSSIRDRFSHNMRPFVEERCPHQAMDDYGTKLLFGTHFTDETVNAPHTAGPSVVYISNPTSFGSAVLVDLSRGHGKPVAGLMSAYHVLFDDDGHFKTDVQMAIGGTRVPITASMVVWKDRTRDLVTLRLPQGYLPTNTPLLRMATTPPKPGTSVWMIGYPGNQLNKKGLRTYTRGTVAQMADGAMRLNIRCWPGNSGGAIIQRSADGTRYEVVSITSRQDRRKSIGLRDVAVGTEYKYHIGEVPPWMYATKSAWLYNATMDAIRANAELRNTLDKHPQRTATIFDAVHEYIAAHHPQFFASDTFQGNWEEVVHLVEEAVAANAAQSPPATTPHPFALRVAKWRANPNHIKR